jgi:hypothetical protein
MQLFCVFLEMKGVHSLEFCSFLIWNYPKLTKKENYCKHVYNTVYTEISK